jgi:transposase
MSYIEGIPREQIILFPQRLDEVVAPNDPARLIDAFCSRVPFERLGFTGAIPAATGRPSYDPAIMLRLFLWGFVNGVTSSRQLEKATKRSVDVMWLMGRLEPDFKTISEFRRKNVDAIPQLMGECRAWMQEQELISGEMVAIDGSKFRASNGRGRNYTERGLAEKRARTAARIKEYMEQLERADAADEASEQSGELSAEQTKIAIEKLQEKKDFLDALIQKMADKGVTQISLTDPESRLMKTNDGMNVCFNAQIAVDTKHHLIVAQAVTNEVNDEKQLHAMAIAAKEALVVETLVVLADAGYVNSTEIAACEKDGITTYVPEPIPKGREGRFAKADFRYDATTDTYTCPAGQVLTHFSDAYDKRRLVHYYRTRACRECPLRPQCTTSKGRRISRRHDEAVRTAAARRMRGRPDLMIKRRSVVEHPFGTMKRMINRGYFLLRGLKKVTAEFTLAVLAYNFKRMLTLRPLAA